MQLIECFHARGWAVDFGSAATRTEQAADLSPWQVRETALELNSSGFDRFVEQLQPDLVVFDRFVTEEQFGWRVARTCPDALRVLDTEDLHSLRAARQKWLKERQKTCPDESAPQAQGPILATPEELFQRMAGSDLAQREVAAIYRSDLSLIISDFEMTLLNEAFGVPEGLLAHTPFMPAARLSVTPDFDEREHFVTIGNFRHPPNWDSVLWLKHHLWPAIRARLPRAQLHIYGAYQPAKATALHNPAQGFHLCGWAEDALQVMARARVCLAPLRFGAGLKGKLLDAMLCDTPSVTTSIGAEGMAGELPWGGAIADTAEQLVDAAVNLYQDEMIWQQGHEQGRAILAERFDSEAIGNRLLTRIDALRADLDSHRRNNFIGAMLNHHHHKSTQYFSQWIEAKNGR